MSNKALKISKKEANIQAKAQYCLVSRASRRNPTKGIRLINKITSEYKIPVNWIINLKTVEVYHEFFDKYHQKKGDQLIFELQTRDSIMNNPGMEKYHISLDKINDKMKYKNLITEQTEKIKQILPWADFKVARLYPKNEAFTDALRLTGFSAVWGIEWNYVSNNPDFLEGIPFGVFPLRNKYGLPISHQMANKEKNQMKSQLYAMENTFKDINRCYNSKTTSIYSSNLVQIQKQRICTANNIRYLKNLIEIYLNNTQYNKLVPLIQHIPADEMEFTMLNNSARYPFEIHEAEIILNKFFEYIIGKNIQIQTINGLINQISDANISSPTPIYFFLKDSIIPSIEYHRRWNSTLTRIKYYLNMLRYINNRLFNRPIKSERPEILPRNSRYFPPLFIYQDNKMKLFFKLVNQNLELLRPTKQYIYKDNDIIKIQYSPAIKNAMVSEYDENDVLDLQVYSLKKMPWGVLWNTKNKNIAYVDIDKDNPSQTRHKSEIIEDFVFLYLNLERGLNQYFIKAYKE
ncbi:MAG: hypothetical protein GF364_09445 [Candidatus Lokiarchaeota archaeon]|nr:hypothetical protein [Candidatus Lokiarchaeota archaeon]